MWVQIPTHHLGVQTEVQVPGTLLNINAVSVKHVISKQHSPSEIVLRHILGAKKELQAQFEADVEASQDVDVINTLLDRTHS